MMELFRHQEEGAAWLAARTRGILADPPRMGKTRTLIRALQLAGAWRPLIVCPAIVRGVWERELSAMDFNDGAHVVSWDHATQHVDELRYHMRTGVYDALIVDEFHKAKNPAAQRTRALFGRDGFARLAPRVYLASGTPMHRKPGDLWTIMGSIFPDVAIRHGFRWMQQWEDHFETAFWRDNGYGAKRVVTGVQHVEQLQEILGEIMLRRTPADTGLDLPPTVWEVLPIDGGGLQLSPFEEAEYKLAALGEGGNRRQRAAAEATRREIGLAKARAYAELVKLELEETDEKLVVFAHHRDVLKVLYEAFSQWTDVAYVDGSTSSMARQRDQTAFNSYSEFRIFLGQQQACQEGIDLSVATGVDLVEPSWVAVDNVQASQRVAGPRQTAKSTTCRMITLAGTVDDAVVRQHAKETRMHAEVLT